MADVSDRLSRIETVWSKLLGPAADESQQETHQRQLLLRYYRAAFRYLLGVAREPEIAEELAQEFAVRFMRGDFRHVSPERGRLRDFLKAVLRNLVREHWRKQQKSPELQEDTSARAEADARANAPDDPLFDASWRDELLAKTWEQLAQIEDATGKPYFSVLRLKVQEPQLRSAEQAERLTAALGKPISAEALRQLLHRARESFADLLLREVARTLPAPSRERLEEELIALQLLDYCREALKRRS